MAKEISNSSDLIDVRDVIERFEDLEAELSEAHSDSELDAVMDMRAEWKELDDLLADLKGAGGDEQWRGDWYPITMIRASYFKEYAQQYAEDIGAIDSEARWPAYCIDWDRAANDLRSDYSATEFDGVTYYYR